MSFIILEKTQNKYKYVTKRNIMRSVKIAETGVCQGKVTTWSIRINIEGS
jgi:hypothetical protein